MNYPTDFTEDMRKQGICGVLAIAVAARVTMAEAHKACARNLLPHQKRHVRRTHDDQILACLTDFGRSYREVPAIRQTVRKWVHECSQPNRTYLMFVSGHVLLVKNDVVIDQHCCDSYEKHTSKRQFVQRVLEIY